ncbi:MAG: hypothetical protein CMF31_00605 [Kordiimonas sp.]|nr:hypothetical protein [Kordiimonas sp.]|tara:strand:+ start:433 stop:657 length:225 start_codon:yes stop_codon:yes gene_type:complete
MNGDNILTIDQLVMAFPAFSEKTVRWWIYNGNSNGFEACLIRIGSRIYIDRERFVLWVEKHRPVSDMPQDIETD